MLLIHSPQKKFTPETSGFALTSITLAIALTARTAVLAQAPATAPSPAPVAAPFFLSLKA